MDAQTPVTDALGPATAIARWLRAAEADAERRGLPALKPLLQGLAVSTAALRAAAWNDAADAPEAPASAQADHE